MVCLVTGSGNGSDLVVICGGESGGDMVDTDTLGTTMEEYVQFETEKALRNEFPAIIYENALASKSNFSSEPMASIRLIIKQRVKVNQKAHILELRQRNHEEHCSDNLYAIFIKEDTAYPCPKLHSASTKRISIHRTTDKGGPEDEEPSIMQNEETPQSPFLYHPSNSSNLPFPSRLKKQKKDDDDERLLSNFKQIHINLPFLEAMIHMPKGSKVLKDLLSHKEKLEKTASSVKLSEECSVVIQRSLPKK
ncbi:hypothetical protein Tco_0088223 [Tanacetum coccineum]